MGQSTGDRLSRSGIAIHVRPEPALPRVLFGNPRRLSRQTSSSQVRIMTSREWMYWATASLRER